MGSCFGPLFGGCHQGPIASTGPIFNPVLGLRLGPAHLLFQTPSLLILNVIIMNLISKLSLISKYCRRWVVQSH